MNRERLKKTKLRYSSKGEYTLERSDLHENIITQIMHDFRGEENPIAILMGGGSASGKTWLRELVYKEQIQLGNQFLIIDADEIKKKLPEYDELIAKRPDKMASVLHDESSDISSSLLTRCISEKINFIYDGTMKNFQKYNNIIDTLIETGYEIRGIIADVDVNEAIRRNKERFTRTNRMVPVNELIKSHTGVSETFMKIKDKLTEYALYDTFDDYLIFAIKTIDYGEKVFDEERMQTFINKAQMQFQPGKQTS
ncbi:hypothetical protein J2TS6_46670 [Paenibacillus albilobatus]|uniref:UDP-N-acetylglucosamine kinase n=1 Tax=Paenibacillus albilobatus TaxID=2716884 RepID=A0A919XJU5_9BACL|nr:zeta toxin family protein [Paenibacillus albilobatus]GIO33526.1 hypothetical protein J2TS6_46670 [Paenibacillus albilobatus]